MQLTTDTGKHGCLYLFLFGWVYLAWLLLKWTLALLVLVYYDWWMALVKMLIGKRHIWVSLCMFSFRRKTYYCHSCGYNFRA